MILNRPIMPEDAAKKLARSWLRFVAPKAGRRQHQTFAFHDLEAPENCYIAVRVEIVPLGGEPPAWSERSLHSYE